MKTYRQPKLDVYASTPAPKDPNEWVLWYDWQLKQVNEICKILRSTS